MKEFGKECWNTERSVRGVRRRVGRPSSDKSKKRSGRVAFPKGCPKGPAIHLLRRK